MAKVRYNGSLNEIRGAVGQFVYKRGKNGQGIVSRFPDMEQVGTTPAQRRQRDRMTEARYVYSRIKADPARLADYTRRAQAAGLNVWLLVSREYMRADPAPETVAPPASPEADGRDGTDAE